MEEIPDKNGETNSNGFRCLRCGYCCIDTFVVIVDDPKKGIEENNLIALNTKEKKCPHFIGNEPGKYACAVHEMEWYVDTPCYRYNAHKKGPCLMGRYLLEKKERDNAENKK